MVAIAVVTTVFPSLSSQEIGPLGALVLSTNLAYNMALQRLIMHHADIRAAGAMYIASAIRRQRINTIRELDISYAAPRGVCPCHA